MSVNESQVVVNTPHKTKKRLSNETRELIVDLVINQQKTQREVSKLLKIPESTVRGVVNVFLKCGRIKAVSFVPKKERKITKEAENQILAWFDHNPTYTNREIAVKLRKKFGITVTPQTISKVTKRNKLTFKMIHEVIVTHSFERIKQLRKDWANDFQKNQPSQTHMFFVDEAGFNIHLHRSKGRSISGMRANYRMTGKRAANFTLIAAIGVQGLAYDSVHLGSVNGSIFLKAMEEFLDVLDEKFANEIVEGISPDEIPGQPLLDDNDIT